MVRGAQGKPGLNSIWTLVWITSSSVPCGLIISQARGGLKRYRRYICPRVWTIHLGRSIHQRALPGRGHPRFGKFLNGEGSSVSFKSLAVIFRPRVIESV